MDNIQDKEKLYRQFIKRKIIELSTNSINGINKYLHIEQSKIYDKLIKSFVYPNIDVPYVQDDEILGQIYKDKQRVVRNPKTGKETSRRSMPIYDYFDLDTLYSYYKFIENIFSNGGGGKRFFYTVQDFDKALQKAKLMLLSNEGIDVSGYYNLNDPIKCLTKSITMTNGKKREVFAPERTMSPTEFVKKYGNLYSECEANLDKYMKEKHTKRLEKQGKIPYTPNNTANKKPEGLADENIIDPYSGQIGFKF